MPLKNLPGVEVLRLNTQGRRGDFSMIQGYLDAVDWLFSHSIDFDWLINITGQDYPTQPISQIEKFLAETNYDGFLEYFEVFSKQVPWGIKESRKRYLYRYWYSGLHLSLWQRALFKFPKFIINNVQPFIRINWSYDGLVVGFRSNSNPFNEDFVCYAGSYFHTISKKCVQFLYKFFNSNKDIVNYYKETFVPVESFVQSVLVNSGLFTLCNDHKRYIDWSTTRNGQPRILTVEHYPALTISDTHFARKFDMTQDSKILDMLDARILQGS